MENRHSTLPSLTTATSLVEQALIAKPTTAVSDDPHNFAVLTPNSYLLARAVVLELGMHDQCWRLYKKSQASNAMNRQPRSKTKECLVQEAVRRSDRNLARVSGPFPGSVGVNRPANNKTTIGVLEIPAVL